MKKYDVRINTPFEFPENYKITVLSIGNNAIQIQPSGKELTTCFIFSSVFNTGLSNG